MNPSSLFGAGVNGSCLLFMVCSFFQEPRTKNQEKREKRKEKREKIENIRAFVAKKENIDYRRKTFFEV